MYILLLQLVGQPQLREFHVSAIFKWAKLLAKGVDGVSASVIPQVVQKRAKQEYWSDEDSSPSYRPKRKETSPKLMLPTPVDVVGTPSPSSNKMIQWSPGPARSLVLPAREEGDVDMESWLTFEKRVCFSPPSFP